MDTHTFITCILAVTMLTLTPGVDTMLVIRNSGRGGWSDGATTSLGICCGLFVHATLSALGISIILMKTAWAFTLLKYAGAGYLIWLGVGSMRQAMSKPQLPTPAGLNTAKTPFHVSRSLREGFLSNVLNPKTILFYMAFLPQFIDPARPPLQQSLYIAFLHFCIGMVYQCSLAAMVTKAKRLLKGGTAGRVLNGLCGTCLMYIGFRLAVAKQ